jgi:hypothetical protein
MVVVVCAAPQAQQQLHNGHVTLTCREHGRGVPGGCLGGNKGRTRTWHESSMQQQLKHIPMPLRRRPVHCRVAHPIRRSRKERQRESVCAL